MNTAMSCAWCGCARSPVQFDTTAPMLRKPSWIRVRIPSGNAVAQLKSKLRDAFRAHGQSIPPSLTIPRRVFAAIPRVAALFAPPKLRRALSTLPIYLDYLADNQGFDNTVYTRWLAEQGLRLPHSDSFLPVILERYLQQKYG